MSINATLYRCNASLSTGTVITGAMWRQQPNPADRCTAKASKRTKIAGAFVAVCPTHDVVGGRNAETARPVVKIDVTDDHRRIAYGEITAEMLAQAERQAYRRYELSNGHAAELADTIVDRFVTIRAKAVATGDGDDTATAWRKALSSHLNLPDMPSDPTVPGTNVVSGSMAGFGDGFDAEILAELDAADAEILTAWQDAITSREARANGIEATAYAHGLMVTVYPPVTPEVARAALAYVEIGAMVRQ